MKRAGLLLLGLLTTVPACAADLTVSAASSLTESFRELGAAYEKAHPGTKVDFNFAASGVLLQQISRGAPVDVFASADETTMDQAQQQDLLAAGTREVFAVNALWVVVPPQAKVAPRSLKDLTGAGVQRIAPVPAAQADVRAKLALSGALKRPLVVQFNNNDPTIVPHMQAMYPQMAAQGGARPLPRVLPPVGEGHCGFSEAQVVDALKAIQR